MAAWKGFIHFWIQLVGSCFPLAQMAMILIRLPCSEVSVERAFAHLCLILGKHRQSIGDDLLDAILVIRLTNSFSVGFLDERLRAIEESQQHDFGRWSAVPLPERMENQFPTEVPRYLE
jgi:hypothetical protein